VREKDHLEDLDIECRIILKLVFKKHGQGGVHFIYGAQDKGKCWGGGCCEHGREISGYLKLCGFLTK
jgi:hypothetical protein